MLPVIGWAVWLTSLTDTLGRGVADRAAATMVVPRGTTRPITSRDLPGYADGARPPRLSHLGRVGDLDVRARARLRRLADAPLLALAVGLLALAAALAVRAVRLGATCLELERLADVVLDPSKPAPLCLGAAAQLARSLDRFGPLIDADQEAKLVAALDRETDPDLRTALATALDALRPEAAATGRPSQGNRTPAAVAPAPAAPGPETAPPADSPAPPDAEAPEPPADDQPE